MSKDNLDKCKQNWQLAIDGWSEWLISAKRAYRYYLGQQWDAETVEALKREKRPALTLNKIRPTIRNLSGYQRQNRQDLSVTARRGGSGQLAEAFTELLKYFYDQAMADWHVSHAFFDGVCGGKGWVTLDIDYQDDPLNGDLIIARESPFMIFEDPYAKRYDLKDAGFVFRTMWMDKEQVERQFGKKIDRGDFGSMPPSEVQEFNIDLPGGNDTFLTGQPGVVADISRKRFLVKECWHREWKKQTFVINTQTLEVEPTDKKKEELQHLVNRVPILRAVERVVPVLHLTTYVGDEVLQDEKDPFNGISEIPLVRFANDWINLDRNYIQGEIDPLIDVQNEHNKRRSQALHHLNSGANSGWMYEENALDADEAQKLERMGSMPGITVKVKSGQMQNVKRIEPAGLSQGHIQLEQLAEEDIRKISGVNPDLLGLQDSANDSGVAIDLRRKQGLITIEPSFDNFEYSQRILGNTILEFLRKTDVLSVEEMALILSENSQGKDISQVEPLLRSRAVGRYNVVMTTRPSNPTVRAYNFATMLQAVQQGLPIPPDMIVAASDWPFKQELINRMQAAQQAQAGQPTGPADVASVAEDIANAPPEPV